MTKSKPLKIALLSIVILTITSQQRVYAQSHRFSGIDHIGMNVPDINLAVKFFTDVMGFVPVTTIGHMEMDPAWKKRYKIHPDAELEKIVSLRAGNGANIELFQYKSRDSNQEQPYNDDMGLSHIAFYTGNLKESVAFLKTKGIDVLNDPIKNTTGPTAGETWVYFLTPWGAKIELISYPDGKAYEKTNPAIKLWSPNQISHQVTASTIGKANVNSLVARHLEIWNTKDKERRTDAVKSVYSEQITIVSSGIEYTGQAELNKFIDELHAKKTGYIFTHQRPIESQRNLARLFWSFGPPSDPDLITGMDIFIIDNGRIQSLYVFLDAPR
jgi:catechol 2,3-dioxygenase-like lactoylglutathione lyase family enzyme